MIACYHAAEDLGLEFGSFHAQYDYRSYAKKYDSNSQSPVYLYYVSVYRISCKQEQGEDSRYADVKSSFFAGDIRYQSKQGLENDKDYQEIS